LYGPLRKAEVVAFIEGCGYLHLADEPSHGPRRVSVQVWDSQGGASEVAYVDIDVLAVNDPPRLYSGDLVDSSDAVTRTRLFREGGQPAPLFGVEALLVEDDDDRTITAVVIRALDSNLTTYEGFTLASDISLGLNAALQRGYLEIVYSGQNGVERNQRAAARGRRQADGGSPCDAFPCQHGGTCENILALREAADGDSGSGSGEEGEGSSGDSSEPPAMSFQCLCVAGFFGPTCASSGFNLEAVVVLDGVAPESIGEATRQSIRERLRQVNGLGSDSQGKGW
jgi:hypothetical protein